MINCKNVVFHFHCFGHYCLYHFAEMPLSLRDTFKSRKSSHLPRATDCLSCLCHERRVEEYPDQTADLLPFLLEKPRCVLAAVAGQDNIRVPSLMPPVSFAAPELTYPFLHFSSNLAAPSPAYPAPKGMRRGRVTAEGKVGKGLLE